MINSKITSVYRVENALVALFFVAAEIIRKQDFPKNKILVPPEFLFFRRITFFRSHMLFSRRRGVVEDSPTIGGTSSTSPTLSSLHSSASMTVFFDNLDRVQASGRDWSPL
jgi:hypothetical protein